MEDTPIVVHEEFAAALNKEREWVFGHLNQVLAEYERHQARANKLAEVRDQLNRRLRLIDQLLTEEKPDPIPF